MRYRVQRDLMVFYSYIILFKIPRDMIEIRKVGRNKEVVSTFIHRCTVEHLAKINMYSCARQCALLNPLMVITARSYSSSSASSQNTAASSGLANQNSQLDKLSATCPVQDTVTVSKWIGWAACTVQKVLTHTKIFGI